MTETKTHAQRQREYYQRMRDAGFSRVSVWVPEARRGQFNDIVDKLTEEWELDGLFPSG